VTPEDPAVTGRAFVGREHELSELRRGLVEATAGRGSLLLVVGEPGIGKTRLADAFSAEAARAGARVVWGRCWEAGGAPAYWPWVEALRAYGRAEDQETLAAQMGAGAAHVARILPLAARLTAPDDVTALESLDPEQARFALFDAVTSFLDAAAAEAPLVIVLDDLQAADRPSLLLLQYVAGQLRGMRVLVVATCREADADLAPAARDALGVLARHARTIPLRGLTEGEVARLLAGAVGSDVPHDLASAIHAATGGNAFFADELIRLLRAEGRLRAGALPDPPPVPQGVRGAVRRRLAALGEETCAALAVAAVIGREFDVEVLARVCEATIARMTDLLAPAAASRIAHPPAAAPGGHRFAHVLIRQVLYDDLPPGRRLALHARIAQTLASLSPARRRPAEVAHHFLAALPVGDPVQAVTWATEAGDQAVRLTAHEEAAAHYEGALRAMEVADTGDERRRCDLLLALGEARAWAGDTPQARDAFQRAAETARGARLPERLARAALGYGQIVVKAGFVDEQLVALLRDALAALPRSDSPLRVRLLGRLARELHFAPNPGEREALSGEAVAMARRIGDPETVAFALGARHVATWSPDTLDERLAGAEEIVRLAAAAGDRRLLFDAHVWRASDLVEAGEVAAADASMQACRTMEADLHTPTWTWQLAVYDSMRALLDGRFDDAERFIRLTEDVGERTRGTTARRYGAAQWFMLGRERGTLAAHEDTIRRAFADLPDRRARLAALAAELGRAGEARAELEHAPVGALTAHRHNMLEVVELWHLVAPCALLRDTARAAALYERLIPHADRIHVRGVAGSCDGSISRHLGVLATVLERWEDGDRHFRHALERNARLGSPPLVARTRVDYARLLLARGAPEDRSRAVDLLEPALASARALGMAPLGRRARELLESAADVRPATPRGPDTAVLRQDGDVWTIEHDGAVLRLRGSRGLRHLARLLGAPAIQIHALELAGTALAEPTRAISAGEGLAVRRAGADDAGPLLDPQAKDAYRRRLAVLREEHDQAARWHDTERVARSKLEIEALTQQLAAAVGLGGRDRPAVARAERARMSVSKAIRTAIRRIGEHDPELGEHLAKAVRTGTFCAYAPDPRATIRWTVIGGPSPSAAHRNDER
jgi:hypothetical protein